MSKLVNNTPSPSPQSADLDPEIGAHSSNKKVSGQKQRRQHTRKLNKKIKELEQKLKDTKNPGISIKRDLNVWK